MLSKEIIFSSFYKLYSLLSFVAPDVFKIGELETFVDHFKSLQGTQCMLYINLILSLR